MTTDIFFNPIWDVRVTDTSLRDGSHHKRHQFTKDEVGAIVAALDAAGVPVIEVTHGDGLGGSSFNYGFSKTPEQELIKLAAETAKEARIAFLMLPGVGTKEDIKEAQNNGGSICRIATHCTEADVSIQHFGLARELGLETVGFLMMSHTISPEKLAQQARIMADAGCQCVYVVDSAGAMVLDQAADRVAALVAELRVDAEVGFHGHENLGLGVANTILAIRAGATQADGCTAGDAGDGLGVDEFVIVAVSGAFPVHRHIEPYFILFLCRVFITALYADDRFHAGGIRFDLIGIGLIDLHGAGAEIPFIIPAVAEYGDTGIDIKMTIGPAIRQPVAAGRSFDGTVIVILIREGIGNSVEV